mgnify:CR=1 FL=1
MGKDLKNWNPEDPAQWEATGKVIAARNLWISIPALLCGFAVWLYWGTITVQMINLDYGDRGPVRRDPENSIDLLHPSGRWP